MDEYIFKQCRNGFIVSMNGGMGLINRDVWVFNSMDEMGTWVSTNFKPADTQNAEQKGGK